MALQKRYDRPKVVMVAVSAVGSLVGGAQAVPAQTNAGGSAAEATMACTASGDGIESSPSACSDTILSGRETRRAASWSARVRGAVSGPTMVTGGIGRAAG